MFDIHLSYCVERWPTASLRRLYSVFTFSLQFCLPLIATVIMYARIYARLRTRRLRRRSTEVSSRRTSIFDRRRRTSSRTTHGGERTTRILIAIVTSFVACWLPWNVLSMIAEMDRSLLAGHNFKLIDIGLKTIALTGSACINPVFYCWLNDGFRAELIGSLSNVRLRVLASSVLYSQAPGHAKRGRPEGNDERHLSTAERNAADMMCCVTDLPRIEVRSPSSPVDDISPQQEVEYSHVTQSDKLSWYVISNVDYTSVTSYCRLTELHRADQV